MLSEDSTADSELDVESGRAGLDRLEDVLERAYAAERLEERCPRPHPDGGVAAKASSDRGQAERAPVVLLEDLQRRKYAQHPIQRGLVRAGRLGQPPRAQRTVSEKIGDPELGDRIDAPRDVDAPEQSQQLRRGRALDGRCLDLARVRGVGCGSFDWVDRAHGFPSEFAWCGQASQRVISARLRCDYGWLTGARIRSAACVAPPRARRVSQECGGVPRPWPR